jgi:putative endonuclease
MHYVYILFSQKDGRFYVGSTGDLRRRFKEHTDGKVESTRHRRPLTLLAYEAYPLKKEAERREKFLKTSDGKKDLRKRLADTLKTLTKCEGDLS